MIIVIVLWEPHANWIFHGSGEVNDMTEVSFLLRQLIEGA